MKTLFILNGPPYGTEHSYNGIRLAGSVTKRDGEQVRVFLMGDAVGPRRRAPLEPRRADRLDTVGRQGHHLLVLLARAKGSR